MTEEQHDKLMTHITQAFASEKLMLGEAITVWHALGMFLFQNVDKDHKDAEKVYAAMEEYIIRMKEADREKQTQKAESEKN